MAAGCHYSYLLSLDGNQGRPEDIKLAVLRKELVQSAFHICRNAGKGVTLRYSAPNYVSRLISRTISSKKELLANQAIYYDALHLQHLPDTPDF